MQNKLNAKITTHYILVIIISCVFMFFIEISINWLLVIIGSLLSTLIVNQTIFLSLKDDQLIITKNLLLFIPVFKRKINLSEIKELSFYDNVMSDVDFENYVDFEGAIIPKLIIGSYFYKSNYVFFVKYNNKDYESDIHLSDIKINKLKTELRTKLGDTIIS